MRAFSSFRWDFCPGHGGALRRQRHRRSPRGERTDSDAYNDAKFGVLPGYGSPTDFVDNLKRGFDQLWDEGETHPRMMSIGLHPRLIGQASRIHALREFLEHAGKKGKVWFARRIDIANWWNDHQAEFGV